MMMTMMMTMTMMMIVKTNITEARKDRKEAKHGRLMTKQEREKEREDVPLVRVCCRYKSRDS